MYERKDGDGSLFQNEKQNDRQPDYRGTALLGGKEYEIAGWKKATREGKPWLALKVQPKRQRTEAQAAPAPAPAPAEFDDRIPF